MAHFPRLRFALSSASAGAALLGARRFARCDAGYREPPEEVRALADAKPIPAISIQPVSAAHIVSFHTSSMLTLEDISAPCLKLAGAKFNPHTLNSQGAHGPNLYKTKLDVQDVRTGEVRSVTGLPDGARMEHFTWSPDGAKLAFTLRTSELAGAGAACNLWLLDVASGHAAAVHPPQPLNCVLGTPFRWLPDSRSLVIKRPIGGASSAPAADAVPASPSTQESAGGGVKAAVRTYPNLLASAADEATFRHYTTVQLVKLDLRDGHVVDTERRLGAPAMTFGMGVSPDGAHLLTSSIRPDGLSRAVTWSRFGRRIEVVPLAAAAGAAGGGAAAARPRAAWCCKSEPIESMPIGHDAARPGRASLRGGPTSPRPSATWRPRRWRPESRRGGARQADAARRAV